jgi:NAD(P)-dependent dehydrogenase (short-subunit alcohol dehydrogenase family)
MPSSKWTAGQISPQNSKTILITGANSGIGFQAALELARHGAHVLLGVRSHAKGVDAAARIQQLAPGASTEVVELDMASLASIRAFSREFSRPLDVLINNAGVMALPKRELTADGFERQFGTNHLGHFALTGLLLPQLLQTSSPRVVTVSSLENRN